MTNHKAIFDSIETSLLAYLDKDQTWLKSRFDDIPAAPLPDDYCYRVMVTAIFAAGVGVQVFQSKYHALMTTFPDAQTVANYTPEQIAQIKQDKSIIRNTRKIDSCVNNARRFLQLVDQHGSFQAYIDSFDPFSSPDALERLRQDVEQFKHIGQVSSRHYLTMLGMPYIKPDRVNCRIMHRLGFAPTSNFNDAGTIDAVIDTAKQFARATGHSMRYVDLVLLNYGRAHLESLLPGEALRGICTSQTPQCHLCQAINYCQYKGQ